MHVKFWGTRGSIAKAGPTTLRYGGNTSCVEVRADDGTLLVIDCGTGAHGLGQELIEESGGDPIEGHILISHTHWDHIQGLPFFTPLFQPGNTWSIYGPRGLGSSLSETLAGQMQYSYFPVSIEQLAANVSYHDLVEGCFEIGDIRISTHYLNHPALTLGYRIECDGATLVYAADHEPHDRSLADGGDLSSCRSDLDHVRFAEGADLLIHDAQYLASEYPDRVGWGHSTIEYVIDVAAQSHAESVALYHHDPTRTDDRVDGVLEIANERARAVGYQGQVLAASEGLHVELRGEHRSAARVQSAQSAQRATSELALESNSNTVLVAVRSTDLGSTLAEAARAEGLDLLIAHDEASALELIVEREPSVVLLEATPDGLDDVFDLGRAIRALDPPYSGEVALVTVGETAAPMPIDIDDTTTDWLVWPSSVHYIRTKLRAWLLRQANRWQNAPLPADEEERIHALHALSILDTPPEERFDRLTAEISEKLDVPMAVVSLVDTDRQWFKSRHGIDVPETPRDMSMCAHAIHGSDIFQVPDALADPRFADNPAVADDPRLRFYAGYPLELDNGARVGTLCVFDLRPRRLDADQMAELRRVGREVADQLQAPRDAS